jgi:hypothetical protein
MTLTREQVTAPNWPTEGDCPRCGGPFGERPRKVESFGRKVTCYRATEHICGARHGRSTVRCDLRKRDCDSLTTAEKQVRLGVLPKKLPMTASDIRKGIGKRHAAKVIGNPEYLLLDEFQLGTRRVDVLALRLWRSGGTRESFRIIVYEIKVSRADLMHELENPDKRAPGRELATEWYLATPVGLMTEQEVPDDAGLIEFGRGPRGGHHGTSWFRLRSSPPPVYRLTSCWGSRGACGIFSERYRPGGSCCDPLYFRPQTYIVIPTAGVGAAPPARETGESDDHSELRTGGGPTSQGHQDRRLADARGRPIPDLYQRAEGCGHAAPGRSGHEQRMVGERRAPRWSKPPGIERNPRRGRRHSQAQAGRRC